MTWILKFTSGVFLCSTSEPKPPMDSRVPPFESWDQHVISWIQPCLKLLCSLDFYMMWANNLASLLFVSVVIKITWQRTVWKNCGLCWEKLTYSLESSTMRTHRERTKHGLLNGETKILFVLTLLYPGVQSEPLIMLQKKLLVTMEVSQADACLWSISSLLFFPVRQKQRNATYLIVLVCQGEKKTEN